MPGRAKRSGVVEGRRTASYDGDVVVFLIGMRVNKLRALRRWWPVFTAMGPMLSELMKDPDSGLLAYRLLPGWRGATVIQYWESAEKLQSFANDKDRTHRPAWLRFFKDAYSGGSVGVWHETYVVPATARETVYVNMPLLGLAEIAGADPVSRRGNTAAERLSA
jgi:hypothetical protein